MCRFCSQLAHDNEPSSLLSRRGLLHGGILLAAGSLIGCTPQQKPANPSPTPQPRPAGRAISPDDPCAMRLHEICAPLLMHYAMTQQLPARLDALSRTPGFENVRNFTCPATGQPYIYNPVGIDNPDDPARLIAYCPSPAHSGLRQGIAIIEPRGREALQAKVIALPESWFSLNLRVPK